MGGLQSQFDIQKVGFSRVADKCNWKIGLIVDIGDAGKFIVTDIYGIRMGPYPGTLHVGDAKYIYYYQGQRIIANVSRSPVYEIHLKELIDGKIGGGRNKIDEIDDELNDELIDETPPNFIKKYTIKYGPCDEIIEAGQVGGEEYPDDNIADDD